MVRPFLKWAGGKYNLREQILSVLPEGKRLVEPFVGAGAIFFASDYQNNLLADTNPDVINVFNQLKQQGPSFIRQCKALFTAENNRAAQYYQLRSRFNASRSLSLRAKLFVYMNRHGYNGLCRYSNCGNYNVPFGTHPNPTLPTDRMEFFLEHKAQHSEFIQQDFVSTLQQCQPGDVVYCDPPYVPLSATAKFTTYSKMGFTEAQQIQLAQLAFDLSQRGIPVVISNHDLPFTRELYQRAEIISFPVQRTISRNANQREKVRELLAIFC